MDNPLLAIFDEQALVTRAQTDPAAFGAIYDHYFPRVYNYIRYRVRDSATADDLISQVFEKTWRRLDTYRPERAPFTAWLFAIARNTTNDYLRSQQRRSWFSLDTLPDTPVHTPQPEQVAVDRESSIELLKAMSQLNNKENDILALKFTSGMTNRHIAQLIGLSESHVAVIIYRALQRLRRSLESSNQTV